MKKAIVVIDLQNDYFSKGKMELVGMDKVLQNTLSLIEHGKEKGYPLYLVQHISTREGATFFLPNTQGVELHKSLKNLDGVVIKKNFPNSFRETELLSLCKEESIKDLIICGAMTQMCIDSTVRAGFDLGFSIELFADCCGTKDLFFNKEKVSSSHVNRAYFSALDGVFCSVKTLQDL